VLRLFFASGKLDGWLVGWTPEAPPALVNVLVISHGVKTNKRVGAYRNINGENEPKVRLTKIAMKSKTTKQKQNAFMIWP